MENQPRAYKVSTVARMGEMSDRFVRDLIYRKELFAVRVGGEWRIPADAAHKLLGLEAQAGDQSLATTTPAHAFGD